MQIPADVKQQYGLTDPLKIRIETHELYSERAVNLDEEVNALLALGGGERLLDVGCGPGTWLHYLRRQGHTGRLVGLDQSEAMVAEARGKEPGAEWLTGEANALPFDLVAEARGKEPGAEWLTGEANALPFDDRAFDVLTARHMLYHVPDIPGALREFRRVAPAVAVTTNSRTTLPRTMELANELFARFGLAARPLTDPDTFWTETAMDYLTPSFRRVRTVLVDNALVFTAPEPIVRYTATIIPSVQLPDQPGLFAEMLAWLHGEASRRLGALGGVWRGPKGVGLYLCRV